MNTHLVFLVAYLVLLTVLGLWIGRLVTSAGTFFVAGRKLGPVLIFSTMLAANIGAGSTVGATGLGYRDGLSAWWWVGSAGIGSIVLGLWVGPKMWEAATRHNLYTVGDYLEFRYNKAVRGIVAALLWVGTLAILAGQLIALAWVLNVVAGLPKFAGCLAGGAVMTIYFAAGGLLASAWVNILQLVVLASGFTLAVPLVLSSVGGLGGLMESVADPGGLNFWGNGKSGWIYLVMLGPAFIISPGLLQKIYGARDRRTVRIAVTSQGVVLLLFAFAPVFFGMAARVLYPDLARAELALPTLLMNSLPIGIGSLALAAIVSAEISSADAILFMLATSLSQDLYRRFINPQATDRQILKVARWAAVTGGTLGIVLAMALPSVIGSLGIFYSLLSVSLFVPVLAGIYLRRCGVAEALTAVGGGILLLLGTHLLTGGEGFGIFRPFVVGLIGAVAAFLIVHIFKLMRGRNRIGTGI